MVSSALRGVVALIAALAVTSPAWAGWEQISDWLVHTPQPGALMLFLIAVGGLLVGRFASRKRRDP